MVKEVALYLCWTIGVLGIVGTVAFLIYQKQITVESRLASQMRVVIGQNLNSEDEKEIVKLLISNYDSTNDNLIPSEEVMTLEAILASLKVDKSDLGKKVIEKVTEKKGEKKGEDKESW
jgi:hypothetical protein